MKKLILLVSFMLITSTVTKAGDGSSGCGLGWQILKKNSLVSSFTRTLVNATFSNTLGMTFGTSGCAKHSIVKTDAQVKHFAEANYFQLQKDMAKGSGDYVAALSVLMGCENISEFGATVKKDFGSIYTNEQVGPSEMVKNVKASVLSNSKVGTCRFI